MSVKKSLLAMLVIGWFLVISGVLLSVNFIPIQDLELCSEEEKMRLLNELAWNYPLGSKLFPMGVAITGVSVIGLLGEWFLGKGKIK